MICEREEGGNSAILSPDEALQLKQLHFAIEHDLEPVSTFNLLYLAISPPSVRAGNIYINETY